MNLPDELPGAWLKPLARQSMFELPPSFLHARLSPELLANRRPRGLPAFELPPTLSRRGFLLAGATLGMPAWAAAPRNDLPMSFSPGDESAAGAAEQALSGQTKAPVSAKTKEKASVGAIPADFWQRPRELWLRRHRTDEEIRVVYWEDGKLLSEGYWRVCALLKDRVANVMTTMDPTLLDVLRGIHGYYEAWNWRHPIVITSGYRTAKTNAALSKEGAAKNSMHLYGKAVDLFVPGIPTEHIASLGRHLQQGGVGFYPSRGFTHLDTGKLRVWRGK